MRRKENFKSFADFRRFKFSAVALLYHKAQQIFLRQTLRGLLCLSLLNNYRTYRLTPLPRLTDTPLFLLHLPHDPSGFYLECRRFKKRGQARKTSLRQKPLQLHVLASNAASGLTSFPFNSGFRSLLPSSNTHFCPTMHSKSLRQLDSLPYRRVGRSCCGFC